MMILIILQLLLIVIIQETLVSGLGTVGVYFIRPLLWLSLAFTSYIFATKINQKNILNFKRIRHWYVGKTPVHAGLMIGGFQISLLIIIALFTEFGQSPYSFSPISIIINMFYVGSFLVGYEITRSYIINTSPISKKNIKSGISI